ncbi:hypothetical protein NM688_g8184 [Phlebia brevispora]|uniref:Uncharacterized protein n=1 Tax=Phlebia brevispora TaxID=194682 RepID=A0ACC1RW83_9APHY|nr:hypothetical protein NM688_g8184 [Phlebia brevispora]
MIPLARRSTSRKLGTTLVSYTRQSLPRPARFYSAPTKKAQAPAVAAANSVPSPEYPAFLNQPDHQPPPQSLAFESSYQDMESFLRRRNPYTILPTPLPDDDSSPLNDFYFTPSPTQDQIAVIDACLHNLYDVPRAQEIFQTLRQEKPGDPILSVRLYNSLLAAYVEMATTKETSRATYWMENVVALYESMENPANKVVPNANTFAIMLSVWQRFNPNSETPLSAVIEIPEPKALLRDMVDCNVSVAHVVADRTFTTSDQASYAMRDLSKAAVELNMSWIKKEPVVNEDGTVTLETEQENEYEVPFNLANLRKHLAQVAMARRVLPDDTSARQKLLEESVYDVAAARLKHQGKLFEELGITDKGLKGQDLRTWMWNWHVSLEARLKAEVANLIKEESKLAEGKIHTRLSPFMTLIKPEKLSLITILEIMHLQSSGGLAEGMKTTRALLSVGKAVETEYKAEMCKKNHITVPVASATREQGFFTHLGYRALHARRVAAAKYMEDTEEWTAEWTQTVRVRVGSFLVDSLMDTAKVVRHGVDKTTGEEVTEEQPAFYHGYEYVRGTKLGVIKLNKVVSERIARDQLRETLHPRHLPMLIKPKPWLSHDQGGYLYNKTAAMRYKDSQEQLSYLKEASALGNLELVYASLDVLGTTPWQINRDIFNVVLEVWNLGKRLGKLPPAEFDEPEPEKPEAYDSDPKARNIYLMRMKQYLNDKANNHSDRCNVNYKIEIARTFLGDTIYMPHNLDFRGRAYPIPPHLNHIGDDLSRGLLKFGEAKPLGETGLRWLKIHLANLYGYDKGTFEERVQFVHDHLADIYDSADHPLDGQGWWQHADDPWQCLATCKELKAALESSNPTTFLSNLPVHQDGTCNGLQHYAALGGDARGARQVNLSVTDKPSDVYTYVADMVQEEIKADVAKGDKTAILLDGKIARKVVKQTVMTTVYGVTYIAARRTFRFG